MTNQHGGPRPKQRPDDKRGGAGRGQGRKKSVGSLRRGDYVVMERETIGGEIQPPQLWQVISVGGDDGNLFEFQCGGDLIVFRPPEGVMGD